MQQQSYDGLQKDLTEARGELDGLQLQLNSISSGGASSRTPAHTASSSATPDGTRCQFWTYSGSDHDASGKAEPLLHDQPRNVLIMWVLEFSIDKLQILLLERPRRVFRPSRGGILQIMSRTLPLTVARAFSTVDIATVPDHHAVIVTRVTRTTLARVQSFGFSGNIA